MFTTDDLIVFVEAVGESEKKAHDYTLTELHFIVNKAIEAPISDRSFRRIVKGLGIKKSDNGYYLPPDAILIIGWLKNKEKYSSYREYWQTQGKDLYTKAMEIDYYAC